MSSPSIPRPLRTVLVWLLLVTAALAAIAGLLGGRHAAVSAALGGGINVVAGAVYAGLVAVGTRGRVRGAHVALIALFRAEAGKVLAIIAQLWLVLSLYGDVVPAAFFPAFVITVIVFSMAIFVSD